MFLHFPFWLRENIFFLVLQVPDYSKFVFQRVVGAKKEVLVRVCGLSVNFNVEV